MNIQATKKANVTTIHVVACPLPKEIILFARFCGTLANVSINEKTCPDAVKTIRAPIVTEVEIRISLNFLNVNVRYISPSTINA